ncbi:Rho GTPase activation protein, partial [Emericellopsis atlantica]
KRKPFGLLKRTKSLRDNLRDIANPSEQQHDPMPTLAPQSTNGSESPSVQAVPAQQHTERSRRDVMESSTRNPSEDREPPREGQATREQRRDKSPKGAPVPAPVAAPAPAPAPAPVRENGHSTFFSGLKNSSTKAAGMFNRGFFKGHRSASTHEHQHSLDDEHYELKVLNLPLAAQTRKTRISKRLEDSRDKTEFWMPAFPWRAIDYLNFKGCEVEGLYRVPGSGPQIKKWQRRFDEEHDVNLFEAEDLYDINIIGSMLKAWLRELPEELFPKAAQERIARECAGAETVPQLLIDELSNLSPFQYYLLFAITCHLSLLLANSDKNKMDFRNLCICFQPCMKIDAFCFKFLVCDWRDCWKGCANEAAYIEQEYILLDEPPPQGLSQSTDPAQSVAAPPAAATRRSPSESSQRSADGAAPARVPQQTQVQESQSKDSVGSNGSTISTTLTFNSEQEAAKSRSGELRRLSPIQPLSPLGFQ